MPLWPEDGRIYVALGKVFVKQLKYAEARTVYERGCQATQGENTYIWQVLIYFSYFFICCAINFIRVIFSVCPKIVVHPILAYNYGSNSLMSYITNFYLIL